MPFAFLSITCPIWVAAYRLKYYSKISVGSETLCISRTTTDLINVVKPVNLLLIRMKKKQGSEYVCIILLVKKIFEKHFKVFHKFADTANKATNVFSL